MIITSETRSGRANVAIVLVSMALMLWGLHARAVVPTPVLKWRNGGLTPAQYNKGLYSSAAVADLNGDSKKEIVWASYRIYCFDGATGNVLWSFYAGTDRANPDYYQAIGSYASVVIADINGDGQLEIVVANELGWLCAYTKDGYFLPGFPTRPTGRTDTITSLSAFDLDGDGKLEIIIGWAAVNNLNCCIVRYDGSVASGWPQYLPNEFVNALGIYNANIAVADLDGDGYGELIVPSDTGKTCAYRRDGSPLPANAVFGTYNTWPKVTNYEAYQNEKAGWAPNAQFWMGTDHPATVADVNGDGTYEIVIVGEVYTNPPSGNYVSLYSSPFIYNVDRTRFNKGGLNWEDSLPRTGAPLSVDNNLITPKRSNPVVADLDGDGNKEILTSSSDGKLHCYWLDKTEHYSWPFAVTKSGEGIIRFSSEPVAVDLDGDGTPEVIFTTWPQYYSNKGGELFILNYKGEVLQEVALPYGDNGYVGELNFDGCLAAPTVDDVDGDGQPEIVLGTVYAGLLVYDLPGCVAGAEPWPTGRGDYARTGWARSTCAPLVLSNQIITTTQIYTSCGTLSAGPALLIVSPGNVTLWGGTRVVLRNGFSVGSGAALTAGIDPSLGQ